jgi:hypothetical protein
MEMDPFWILGDNDEPSIPPDNCLSSSTTIGSTLRKRQDICGTVRRVEDDLASEDVKEEEVEDYWCSATSQFGVTNIPVCNDDEHLKRPNPYATDIGDLEGALFGYMTLFKCRISKPFIPSLTSVCKSRIKDFKLTVGNLYSDTPKLYYL